MNYRLPAELDAALSSIAAVKIQTSSEEDELGKVEANLPSATAEGFSDIFDNLVGVDEH